MYIVHVDSCMFTHGHSCTIFIHTRSLPDTDEGSTDTLSPPHPSLSSTSHTHCTQSYVLNNRLFPIPHSSCSSAGGVGGKKCPVCEGRREREGKQPVRYIRSEPLCLIHVYRAVPIMITLCYAALLNNYAEEYAQQFFGLCSC